MHTVLLVGINYIQFNWAFLSSGAYEKIVKIVTTNLLLLIELNHGKLSVD